MKKKILILTILISCFFTGCNVTVAPPKQNTTTILGTAAEFSEKYTLYIGLNDKDSFEQVISTEDAIDKANLICAEHAGGYTQLVAKGGWTTDEGHLGHENTLVYIVYDISEEALKAMLDDLIKEFNQSSVLVEKNEAAHIYYSGQ